MESPGVAVAEVVKAASAKVMDRNADGKIQMAIISFLISRLAPHTRGPKEREFPRY